MEKTLNESISQIKVNLQKSNLKKTGKNKFQGFEYFELSDFLPRLNELMLEEGVNDIFTIEDEIAKLTLIKKDEKQVYQIPFVLFEAPLNKQGQPSMQEIQYLGALNTYYKRYLYINAFSISDGEIIDSMDTEDLQKKEVINYKQLLMDKLVELGIDIPTYAKENKVNGKTTQARAKELLEKLESSNQE